MWIHTQFQFEAAHRLPNVPAEHKCARLHGHSFRATVWVKGEIGAESGWVMDFADVKAAFAPLHEQLDHRYLNEIDGLDQPNERGARHLDLGPSRRRPPRSRPRRRRRDVHLRLPLRRA